MIRKDAKSVLLWSAILFTLGTAGGFWFEHPWRVAPAGIGALAGPVLLVSYTKVIWRMRKRESRLAATQAVYEGDPFSKFIDQWAAIVFFLLLGFLVVFFFFVFNLLHVFNVK